MMTGFILSLTMAILFALNVWRGFRTGYVGIGISETKRIVSPTLYWFGMMLSIAGAVFMGSIAAIGFWKLS